jgi:hypothetical protein
MNIKEWFEIGIVFVAVVIWLVRLEGKIKAVDTFSTETQKDVDDLRSRHEALDSRIIEQLARIRESLARLEGKFGINEK